jgi:hypothetical protein
VRSAGPVRRLGQGQSWRGGLPSQMQQSDFAVG